MAASFNLCFIWTRSVTVVCPDLALFRILQFLDTFCNSSVSTVGGASGGSFFRALEKTDNQQIADIRGFILLLLRFVAF